MDTGGWKHIVAKYEYACAKRALWQLTNTFVPYALLWYAMYRVLEISIWLTVPLAVVSAAFLVRIFIIFHDCTHGSYFQLPARERHRRLHRRCPDVHALPALALGTRDPSWQRGRSRPARHRRHLDHDCPGVSQRVAPGGGLHYRLVRNPLVLFVLAPLFVFVIKQRFASPEGRQATHAAPCGG